MRGRRSETDRLRQALGRVTGRDRWLLAMLAEHTVLTTPQLLDLGFADGLRQVQNRTLTLHAAGLIDRFRPVLDRGLGSAPIHHLLGPHGAALLAAEHGHTTAEVGYRGPARTLAVAHRMTLAHDVATHTLISRLARPHHLDRSDRSDAAGPGTGVVLAQWWSAARCRRCFGRHVRPDAYLTLTTPARQSTGAGAGGVGWWEMFVEYDTGSETLTRLADKLAGYHDLAAATGIVTPVAIWTALPGREPGARRALIAALYRLPRPGLVPILTASGDPDTATGRVWLPLGPPGHRTERVSLADLAHHAPHPAPGPDPDGAGEVAAPVRGDGSGDPSVLPAPPPQPPHRGRSSGGRR
ncbi:replication-relaxation family protein [Pseudonocardia alni]|uniref:replication-relaxation family protein n=1 Tax=Pseudonocardia alni TaxID=33907 RepID=UPI003409E05D